MLKRIFTLRRIVIALGGLSVMALYLLAPLYGDEDWELYITPRENWPPPGWKHPKVQQSQQAGHQLDTRWRNRSIAPPANFINYKTNFREVFTKRSSISIVKHPAGHPTKVSKRTLNARTKSNLRNLKSGSRKTIRTVRSVARSKDVQAQNSTKFYLKPNGTRSYNKYLINLTDSTLYDRFIKLAMGKKSACANASSYDAVMVVHSAPRNFPNRQMFRWLYTDLQKTYPYRLKVFFFIGLVTDPSLHSKLTKEGKQFGDLIQGSFLDSYRNLTYKAIFSYKWLNENCRGLRLLLHVDDDVFMDVHNLFQAWRVLVVNKTNNTIMCDVVFQDIVWRTGKWLVKRSEIAEDKFQFPHCRGYFAALTPDLVAKVDDVARVTPFFWIDDVFIYGFVARKLGATFVSVDRRMARWNEKKFVECFRTQGRRCSLVSVLVRPEKFQYLYSLSHNVTQQIPNNTSLSRDL